MMIACVSASADNNTYLGNTIEGNGIGQPGYGILFESATKGNAIRGNIIRNADGGRQIAGIASS